MSSDTLATVQLMISSSARKSDTTSFEQVRRFLYQQGIKTSYDEDRMIFSTTHPHKNHPVVYTQECNGLILEMDTWKPLMVPPRSLRFNIDTDVSNKFLHQGLYHVYKAQDGTCFNMYYYNNRWTISTAKGYDMNDVKWDGKSYQQLVTECLEKVNLTWDKFVEQLDKNRCYSFGFKHPEFHRFFENGQSVYKVWFIQSIDLDMESDYYLWATDKSPIEELKLQEVYEEPIGALKDLYKIAASALENYIENKEICYGFILRSVNMEVTGVHSDLFIESSLMRTIRKFWYENNLIDMCHQAQWSKETVVTLSAYLDSTSYEVFTVLFPQYADRFTEYSNKISKIIEYMCFLTKGETLDAKDSSTSLTDRRELVLSYENGSVALDLLDVMEKSVRYDFANKTYDQKRRVITEYIIHPANLPLLMSVFTESSS